MKAIAAVLILVGMVAGCTKDNPYACGEDGACGDPSRPFCDHTGAIGGEPGICIAVTCDPGTFRTCEGDHALQCSANGMNYDSVICERGCNPAADGCLLCDPGETTCVNGVAAVCDANGVVVESISCALGCYQDEPRCTDIDPSNDLGDVLAMSHGSPDVVVTEGSVIDVSDGSVDGVVIPSVLVDAPADGVQIRAFPVGSLSVTGTVYVTASTGPAYAVAFLSDGDVTIDGDFYVTASQYGAAPGGMTTLPPQSYPCSGGDGYNDSTNHMTGGGGGGHATDAGYGGDGFSVAGGLNGRAFDNPDLQPLRGGCRGGGATHDGRGPGSGGGAVQISSRTAITIGDGARLIANGLGGERISLHAYGGGGGGGILLEAPVVTLQSDAAIVANGGSGAAGGGSGAAVESPRPSASSIRVFLVDVAVPDRHHPPMVRRCSAGSRSAREVEERTASFDSTRRTARS